MPTRVIYDVVFTANASGALRIIAEAFPFGPGSRFVLTADNHNSVNGIRVRARRRGATVVYTSARRGASRRSIRGHRSPRPPLRRSSPSRHSRTFPVSGIRSAGSERRRRAATACCSTPPRICRRAGSRWRTRPPTLWRCPSTRSSATRLASAHSSSVATRCACLRRSYFGGGTVQFVVGPEPPGAPARRRRSVRGWHAELPGDAGRLRRAAMVAGVGVDRIR